MSWYVLIFLFSYPVIDFHCQLSWCAPEQRHLIKERKPPMDLLFSVRKGFHTLAKVNPSVLEDNPVYDIVKSTCAGIQQQREAVRLNAQRRQQVRSPLSLLY